MNIQKNIELFEAEWAKVTRAGADQLLGFFRMSDFYSAPSSTKYHLSCKGGLLQHSLNVLTALRGMLTKDSNGDWSYTLNGVQLASLSDESLIIIAFCHDLCKTHFYAEDVRNVKNKATGAWEQVPYFTVNDTFPIVHGPKSALLAQQFIVLNAQEMAAICWHMGFSNCTQQDIGSLSNAISMYPIIWAVHSADMMASHFMEGTTENTQGFDNP